MSEDGHHLERMSPTAVRCRIAYGKGREWEHWTLLTADHHLDHPQCQRKLLARHCDEAVERGALAFAFGDQLCVMQGKSDRRADKSDVRPEHSQDAYFNRVTDEAGDFYGQWPDTWALFAEGNHETAVLDRNEIDLTDMLVRRYNHEHGGGARTAPYAGWVFFSFEQRGGNGHRQTVKLMYTHGDGGGGPVTRGVIQTNRRAVYQPDADIVAAGHIHESWLVEVPRERISQQGRSHMDTQYHLQLPTYKEEYLGGRGFHRRKGRPPKPLGGCWVRWYYSRRDDRVRYQFIRTEQ